MAAFLLALMKHANVDAAGQLKHMGDLGPKLSQPSKDKKAHQPGGKRVLERARPGLIKNETGYFFGHFLSPKPLSGHG
jgi:hypothetical protein